jgi:hypothetical protein
MVRILSFAVVLLIPALAAGQATPPDICSAAFRDGLRENYEVLTVKQRFDKLRSQLLSIKSETYSDFVQRATSASAGLEIPIIDSMLGFSADASSLYKQQHFKERYEQLRTDVNFQQQVYESFKSNSSVLNVGLVAIWNDCAANWLDAYIRVNTANGVFLDIAPFDETAGFVARVTVRSDAIRARKVIGISPADAGISCVTSAGASIASNTTFNTQRFELTCRKSPDRTIPFSVTTEDGVTNTVNVPSRTSKLLEMRETFDELLRTVGRLRESLTSAQNEVANLKKGLTVDANGNVTIANQFSAPNNKSESCVDVGLSPAQRSGTDPNFCPDGLFLAGIDMDDIGGVPTQSSPLPARARCCRP